MNEYIKSTVATVKQHYNIKEAAATNGPQGTVSKKTQVSLGLPEQGMTRLQNNLRELAFEEIRRADKRSAVKRHVISHRKTQKQRKKSENEAATKDDSGSRKRRKRSEGSQTCCEECCGTCHNIADSIAAIKEKLDKALNCIQEMEGLKQKQSCFEERNKELETSLEFVHSSITKFDKKVDAQDKAIKQLQERVKSLTKQVSEEKQRSVKLESHSRRNNLNFYNIPEEKDESFQTSENVLRRFMELELKLSKKDSKEISFECVHRIGKSNSNNAKPRPLIAKFTFHRDKEFVLSKAKNLHGTQGRSQTSEQQEARFERRREPLEGSGGIPSR